MCLYRRRTTYAAPVVADVLFTVVAPVFALILVGAALARRFAIDVAPVTQIAIYGAVPALVFQTLASMTLASDAIGRLLAGYGLTLLAFGLLGALLGRALPASTRRTFIGTLLFGNAANMMLPISLFAFGEAGLERALVLYVATALSMFALGPVLVGEAVGVRRSVRTIVTFPVLWAALAGVTASAFGSALPLGLERAVGLLADAAVPLVLLSLGIQMSRARVARPTGLNVAAVGLKLVLMPAVALALGTLVGLRGLDLAVLALLGGMPTAINLAMLAVAFRGDADQVGRTVVLGTLASLVTLPILLALLAPLVR